jgi:hypothetical protein
LLDLRRAALVRAADWRYREQRAALQRSKPDQRERFGALSARASELYAGIRERQDDAQLVPDWNEHVRALEGRLLPVPRFDFLRDPRIMFTMFILIGGRVLRGELELLELRYDAAALRELLEEDPVGDPVILDGTHATSHQSVHQLYHLTRFADATGVRVAGLGGTLLEWGAGYGSLAKLVRRLHGGAPTQVLIDLPVLSLLQWLYLSTVLGPEQVTIIAGPGQAVQEGKVNIVPVGLADAVTGPASLFMSTWALSESGSGAQDYVFARDWFGAEHLLLGYQRSAPEFPHAGRVGERAADDGARVEPVGVLAASRYAFR